MPGSDKFSVSQLSHQLNRISRATVSLQTSDATTSPEESQSAIASSQRAIKALLEWLPDLPDESLDKSLRALDLLRRQALVWLYNSWKLAGTSTDGAGADASPTKGSEGATLCSGVRSAVFDCLALMQSLFESLIEQRRELPDFTSERIFRDLTSVASALVIRRTASEMTRDWRKHFDNLQSVQKLVETRRVESPAPADRTASQDICTAYDHLGNNLYSARQAPHALGCFEKSVELDQLFDNGAPLDGTAAAQQASRLKRLGHCSRTLSRFQAALGAYRQALQLTPASTWETVVQRASTCASISIFEPAPISSTEALARDLVEVSVVDMESTRADDILAALPGIPSDARAALLEMTANHLRAHMHREGCCAAIGELLAASAQNLSDERSPIRLARVKLCQAELAVCSRNDTAADSLLEEAEQLLQKDDFGMDAGLQQFVPHLRLLHSLLCLLARQLRGNATSEEMAAAAQGTCATLYPLLGMRSDVPQDRALMPSLTASNALPPVTPKKPSRAGFALSSSIKTATREESAPRTVIGESSLDDAGRIAELLETAVEGVRAFGDHFAAIEMVRGLRQLCRITGAGDAYIRASTALGDLYHIVGRHERAGSVLRGSLTQVEGQKPGADLRFEVHLLQARHHFNKKQLGTAMEEYQTAISYGQSPVPAKGVARTLSHAKLLERQGAAALFYSHHSLEGARLSESIVTATAAMRAFSRAANSLKQANEILSPSDPSSESATAVPLQVIRQRWSLTRKLIEASLHLGQLYVLRGSSQDAKLLFNEAVRMAEPCGLVATSAGALMQRAELRALQRLQNDAISDLDRARALVAASTPQGIAEAVVRGIQMSRTAPEQALTAVLDALATLESLGSRFQELDNSLPSPAPARTAAISPRVSALSSLTKIPTAMPNLHARLLRQQAWLLHSVDFNADPQSIVEAASHLDGSLLAQNELTLLRARIALGTYERALSADCALSSFADAALATPLLNAQSQRYCKSFGSLIRQLDAALAQYGNIRDTALSVPAALHRREAHMMSGLIKMMRHHLGAKAEAANSIADEISAAAAVSVDQEYLEAIRAKLDAGTPATEWWAMPTKPDSTRARKAQLSVRSSSPELSSDTDDDDETQRLKNFWKDAEQRALQESVKLDLPANWALISVQWAAERNSLVITKRMAGIETLTISLPIDRQSTHEGDEQEETFEAVIDAIKGVATESNEVIHGAKGLTSMEARKAWWTTRRELDQRLGAILGIVEEKWLGCFKVSVRQMRSLR